MSTVQGTVRDSVTKALLPSANVTAPPYTVVNNNGAYSFTTPGATTVDVTAACSGYTSQTATVSVPSSGTVIRNFLLVKSALRSAMAKAPAKKKTAARRPQGGKAAKKNAKKRKT